MKALRALSIIGALAAALSAEAQVTKYVRYAHDAGASYGVVDGDQIRLSLQSRGTREIH